MHAGDFVPSDLDLVIAHGHDVCVGTRAVLPVPKRFSIRRRSLFLSTIVSEPERGNVEAPAEIRKFAEEQEFRSVRRRLSVK